ncbi:hypothetical protein Tsubulata_035307 [Turnera subulata]|uniref:Alpha 1,4-glycosyltransferase domain-containing protein n=1 Tax=Turnera subulata TaxID=218843 RepID=A0A9Q0J2A7_9ROSI|nr:hypothetical protein Tsubulata_035307 [Turnera subulata]
MLRNLRSRRRPRYGAHVCAVCSALLLLLSVSLLYTRLSSSPHTTNRHHRHYSHSQTDADANPLLSDENDSIDGAVDKIDELDDTHVEEQNDSAASDNDGEDSVEGYRENGVKATVSSGFYVDHVTGSIRRALNKRSIEEWDYDYGSYNPNFISFGSGSGGEDRVKAAFGSDDVPVDEEVRRKVSEVDGVEDLLMLKVGKRVSPLREGWGVWFDKKGDFLRRDRMFKSNLEALNPLHNPLLQDPDGVGVTGLTRGDKVVQKLLVNEFKKTPFLVKKPLSVEEGRGVDGSEGRSEFKRAERRTLDENDTDVVMNSDKNDTAFNDGDLMKDDNLRDDGARSWVGGDAGKIGGAESREPKVRQRKSGEVDHVYADGKTWGYFPGLHPHLSFSDFMRSFFRKGKCKMRVFMVWNSPAWMHSVRHQRGLESLLSYHRDACVVVFSETIELDFFKDSFLKDGYKVAVVMPNLDELLKDTPTHIFASVWLQWRTTKFYSTHYSELVRLAALYKYGGIYLDSDIIVLNPISSLNNTVGLEDDHAGSSLNGAVMAFRKHSPFIMECLKEFYMTYDETQLRWNGADLLTRVARNFSGKENKYIKQQELKVQPSHIFFPIVSREITSYFTTPANEDERTRQDALFRKIVSDSLAFHFWNSLTSTLIPEPGSLVTRLIDRACIRCSDVL